MFEDLTILRSTEIVDDTGAEAPIHLRQVNVAADGEAPEYQIQFQQGLSKYAFPPHVAAAVAAHMADLAEDFLEEPDEDELDLGVMEALGSA